MACCLTAPSHYLEQCWIPSLRLNGISLRAISQPVPKIFFYKTTLKIIILELLPHLPEATGLIPIQLCWRLLVNTSTKNWWYNQNKKSEHVLFLSACLCYTLGRYGSSCWLLGIMLCLTPKKLLSVASCMITACTCNFHVDTVSHMYILDTWPLHQVCVHVVTLQYLIAVGYFIHRHQGGLV